MAFSLLTIVVIIPLRYFLGVRHEPINKEPTLFLEFLLAWIYSIYTVEEAIRLGYLILGPEKKFEVTIG